MKERPILFSAPMVRAILDGRKTQTRRALNPQPAGGIQQGIIGPLNGNGNLPTCKNGQKGDHLWVREAWSCIFHGGFSGDGITSQTFAIMFRAGGDELIIERDHYDEKLTRLYDNQRGDWRPSIHMPRWASRINLEITAVRVERLNDMSTADAIAEGAQRTADGGAWHVENEQHRSTDPRDTFASIWESINGAGSWEQNPWVWVIEFRKIQEAA